MEAQPFWVANNPDIGNHPPADQAPQPDAATMEPLSRKEAKKLQEAQFYSHVYGWVLADSHVIVERVSVPVGATKEQVFAAQAETAARIAAADARAAELAASPYIRPKGHRQRKALAKVVRQSKKLGEASGAVKFRSRNREAVDATRASGMQGRWVHTPESDIEDGHFHLRQITEEERFTPSQPSNDERRAAETVESIMQKIDPLRTRAVEAEAARQALRAEKLNDPERRVDWAVAQEAARVEAFRPLFWQRVAEWTNHNLTEASNNGQNLSLEQAQKQARERTMHDLLPYYLGLHEVGDYERLSKQRKEQFATLFGFSTPRRPAEAPSSGYTQF